MIEAGLRIRFSTIDAALTATIPTLMTLSQEDVMQVLLSASREEIIDRFTPSP
ncbi:MAG: hypothetical protein HC860_12895 [Alkalinema sp. RU_4_3]|nr:hypothetical protein [Alkalinema sp. RU_4_3]